MEGRRYSGYLADDESFRRPQDANAHTSPRRDPCDWRAMLRPPSRCQHRTQQPATSTRYFNSYSQGDQGKRKRPQSSSSSGNERTSDLANEFSEFVDFLADEDVLQSLQQIVEDAVQKLRDVTSQSGEPIFDFQEESASSVESETWSYSYSSTCSQFKYQTTTTMSTMSSSDDDQEKHFMSPESSKIGGKICLLDKYVSRLPKVGKQAAQELSGGIHAESFSEQSGESYFQQQHLHIWAKSFEHPRREFFAKFQRTFPQDSLSFESLHKEITNVLKRPMRHGPPMHYICHDHLHAFLEETKVLAGLQDVINQAVLKVLEATMLGGIPFLDLSDDHGYPTSWDSEEEEEEEFSVLESYESEVSEESEEPSDGICKRKGKKKKAVSEDGKPDLPKSKQKPATPEEGARKPKYVPPPLSKTKETPTKTRYVPPPLPKSKKKQEPSQAETETTKSTRHAITPKDIKRARLQGKPVPKQSIIDFLIENAAKLILYKYNYETLLSEKLGFISVPVTKVLLEIMFGYKKIKGSGIRLSSQIDWTKVYDEVYKKRPPKPKVPKQEKKKKGEEKKEKKAGEKKKTDEKKSLLIKPLDTPKGKVIGTKVAGEHGTKKHGLSEQGELEIFEIVPPQFPSDAEPASADENNGTQPTSSKLSPSSTMTGDHPKKSGIQELEKTPSSLGTPKQSFSNRKVTSAVLLPEVDPTSQGSEVKGNKTPKSSLAVEGSKTVLPKI
ncbi:coiled-coil domain-containing protein 116 [Pantherophis guttatus]|uniref:Coiled-coil domain-containing protein 116 n=1 Tax=Pantherophis guttatus TaxID=94885 RepID=A0A6P9D6F1_PANGU|nr:coiled-coil domain-containing protein 116 [Pantherophis guttatus]XP_034291671.1 coiled-coil domain-containing protein 116 [Pantherophis guttatus]XP_034291672.1 coiled-coil domain-containing protein 116 [Pantherophis guttatus]